MSGADACCGLGGSFNLQQYELSSDIGMRKRNNIKISGSSTAATGCPACMIQISDMLSRSGDRIAVKNPIEIYAEAINLPGSNIFIFIYLPDLPDSFEYLLKLRSECAIF
jgi:glycolate oxidase iron-sulfur subunit